MIFNDDVGNGLNVANDVNVNVNNVNDVNAASNLILHLMKRSC